MTSLPSSSRRRALTGMLLAALLAWPLHLPAQEAPPSPALPAAEAIPPRVVPLDPASPGPAPPGQATAPPPAVTRILPLAVPPRPAQPARQASPATAVLTLGLGKTLPVSLPAQARDVVVGNPAIADVMVQSPRQVFVVGRQLGATNIFFLDAGGGLIRRVDLQVGPDADAAQAALAQALPEDPVTVRPVGDSLMLTGRLRNAADASLARSIARRFVTADANVINQLSVEGSQQVLLRVRVAEVNRTLVKDLGLETGINHSGHRLNLALTAGQILSPSNLAGTVGLLPTGPVNFLLTPTALETEGLIKTLAEPNLTTLSGEAARLLAGGETPVPTSNTNGVVTVEWKPFGVGLVFTPIILSNGRINLRVESEVSAIDTSIQVNGGNGIILNGFKTRRANAVVELPSGGSLMMAGLLENTDSVQLSGLPGIRDIPILGTLMGSTAFQRGETELVLTVTAYIVQPVDHAALALPSDGFLPASDLRRYFLMKMHEEYLRKPVDLPAGAAEGPIGYIVE